VRNIKAKLANDRFLIQASIIFFALNIGVAYILYPHWVTFSHLALQAYTLPFFLLAMGITIFLLAHTGRRLKAQELHKAAIAMYTSAICIGLVVLIPYRGSTTQIALHNIAALLFVVFAAAGLAWLGRKLRDVMLGLSAILQIGICILELIFLARFNQHPVYPWVWVVLQLLVTSILLLSLLRIFSTLEKRKAWYSYGAENHKILSELTAILSELSNETDNSYCRHELY